MRCQMIQLLTWTATIFVLVPTGPGIGTGGTFARDLRAPVEAVTELEGSACENHELGLRVNEATAIGLVVYNSPYIFGGRALRDGLTCNACHNPGGFSGAAAGLETKRVRPPSLRAAKERGINLAAFAQKAVSEEFSGPLLDQRFAAGLDELAGALPLAGHDNPQSCSLGPLGLVQLAVEVADAQTLHLSASEREFMIETARFVLGEIERGARSEAAVAPTERAFENLLLKEIEILPQPAGHVLTETLLGRLRGILRAAGVTPISIQAE
jgi:hypothetical protein